MWHILSSITVRLRIRLEGKAPFLQQSHDTVYANGKVDVVFDADASAGYLLSVAEHGLNKMWMPKKKGKGVGGGECKGLLG